MYFPYLSIRMYEAIALLNTVFSYSDDKVIPILDPRNEEEGESLITPYLKQILDRLKDTEKRCILIIKDTDQLKEIQNYVSNLKIPERLMYGIFSSEVGNFNLDTLKNIVILHDSVEYPKDSTNIVYHIFLEAAHHESFLRKFPKDKKVKLEDAFTIYATNRDYPIEDTFSDLYSYYVESYIGFGDYLTLGKSFRVAAGANMKYITVALHLTYKKDGDEVLRVRHYTTSPQEEVVFRDRVKQTLIKANKESELFLFTSGIVIIKELVVNGSGTNLGKLKQISLQHHIDLVHSLIQES